MRPNTCFTPVLTLSIAEHFLKSSSSSTQRRSGMETRPSPRRLSLIHISECAAIRAESEERCAAIRAENERAAQEEYWRLVREGVKDTEQRCLLYTSRCV